MAELYTEMSHHSVGTDFQIMLGMRTSHFWEVMQHVLVVHTCLRQAVGPFYKSHAVQEKGFFDCYTHNAVFKYILIFPITCNILL
jgi:hypothetical protein